MQCNSDTWLQRAGACHDGQVLAGGSGTGLGGMADINDRTK